MSALLIGLSFLLFWAIFFPLVIICRLYKIQKCFSDPRNLKIYGIFYIGLNDDAFYWEIVLMNLRKMLLILCSTVFGSSKQSIKVIAFIF